MLCTFKLHIFRCVREEVGKNILVNDICLHIKQEYFSEFSVCKNLHSL